MPYTAAADPRVDQYIDALPDWQQEICQEVRELVHAADSDVVETVKRRAQPYFVLEGNICALLARGTTSNIFLYERGEPRGAEGDVRTDHREQQSRRLAKAQGAGLASSHAPLPVRRAPGQSGGTT